MATIDTTSAAYLTRLDQLQTIYGLFRTIYGPVLKRMTKAQLRSAYQRDPLLKEIVDMSKDIEWLAERADIEL